MESATYPFIQLDLLQGMTSSLRNGACFGLSVRWLIECARHDPDAAGLAITMRNVAYEAVIKHGELEEGLTGVKEDNDFTNSTLALSKGMLLAKRKRLSSGGGHLGVSMAILTEMSFSASRFYGLISIDFSEFRHALSVAHINNVWSLFDSNFGTWVFQGDAQGAPVRFSQLLRDIFSYYKVKEARLYTTEILYGP